MEGMGDTVQVWVVQKGCRLDMEVVGDAARVWAMQGVCGWYRKDVGGT
jgi:hypothetical protein